MFSTFDYVVLGGFVLLVVAIALVVTRVGESSEQEMKDRQAEHAADTPATAALRPVRSRRSKRR